MIEFWLGITLLTLIALAFICRPLFGYLKEVVPVAQVDRQQENIAIFEERLAELKLELQQNLLNEKSFTELKVELEKNLLTDAAGESVKMDVVTKLKKSHMLVVLALCISLPIFSLGLYSKYGSFDDYMWSLNKTDSHQLPNGEKPTAEQAIGLLTQELERNPDNAEGWYMLAGAYMGMNQYDKGALSFAKVLEILPEQTPQYPSVVGQYAQALFFEQGRVTDKVKAQIERALNLDANEVVSLGLLGIQAFEGKAYQTAIDFWEKALANAQPNAAQALESGITNAKQKLAEAGIAVTSKKPKVERLSVALDVSLSPDLAAGIDPNAIVFVFAKPVDGKVPLAALKLRVSELPKQVVLDDSYAMIPSAKISLQKKVQVSARISMSGQPQAQPGDIQSALIAIDVSKNPLPVKLLINKVVE